MELLGKASTLLKERIAKTAFRDVLTPNLPAFSLIASKIHVTATDALSDLTQPNEQDDEVKQILAEYSDLESALGHRYQQNTPEYPKIFALEQASSLLTYGIVRIIKPSIVLETGVANGHSTVLILNAIIRNGKGKLYSVDISENVGSLLTDREREHWNLQVMRGPSRRAFHDILRGLSYVDFFLHDSDHRYSWQRFEYEAVFPKMSRRSILASDDVDASYAFIDFARKIRERPVILVDGRKTFGYLKLER